MTRTAVIGGGLGGSMAALGLAQSGRDVTLFEKAKGPHHKVCGEFISHEGQAVLRHVGLMNDLKQGEQVETFRLSHRDERASVRLPFKAYSYSRYRLDEALLSKCEDHGVRLLRGQPIRVLERNAQRWRVATTEASDAFDHVVLATGKHDVRGYGRTAGQSDYTGFKLSLRLRPEAAQTIQGHVDIMLFDGGYAGLGMTEEGNATLALIVRRAVFARNDHDFESLYSRIIGENRWAAWLLDGACRVFDKTLSIAGIPYGYVFRGEGQEGLYRVGDQFAVIPSFSGDGISLALTTGLRCAEALRDGMGQREYHRSLYHAHASQVRLALWLQNLAGARWSRSWAVKMVAGQPRLTRRLAAWTRSPLPSKCMPSS